MLAIVRYTKGEDARTGVLSAANGILANILSAREPTLPSSTYVSTSAGPSDDISTASPRTLDFRPNVRFSKKPELDFSMCRSL
jgi:hypothetical protein